MMLPMGSLRLHRAALIAIREARGWNQAELARRAGMNKGNLSRLETGTRPKPPTFATIARIAEALGVDVTAITYPTPIVEKTEEVAA